jgi:hypothetical protein
MIGNSMLLTLVFVFISTVICHGQVSQSGRWEGSVKIPERELKLVVDLAEDKDGAWIGSIIIPGLNIKGAPLTDIALKDSELSFAIKSALGPTKFNGHFSGNGAFKGDFVQAGNTAPFTLEKTGPPQVELPVRSTSITKEFEGEWKGEYELFGYPRHVTIKLANRADAASAEFVVVGKKTNNLPVDLVTQEGSFVRIDSHEIGISYEGRFRKESGEINGTFIQGGLNCHWFCVAQSEEIFMEISRLVIFLSSLWLAGICSAQSMFRGTRRWPTRLMSFYQVR